MKDWTVVEYERELAKRRRNETRKRLIKLWLVCSSFEEFDLKAATDIPEADRLDLLACRLYMFSRNHPVLYWLIWVIAVPALTVVPGVVLGCVLWRTMGYDFFPFGVFSGVLLYALTGLLHQAYFGIFMRTLECYEKGYISIDF